MPLLVAPPEFPTALLARYRFEGLLGSGSMGQVFRAHDLELERPVAIKIMRFTRDPVGAERFRREAKALADLDHPGILKIYDWGEVEGSLYLVTEFLEGSSLDDPGTVKAGAVLDQMMQVAGALEAVHRIGLLHRDIKPSNIVFVDGSRPVLIDFGLVLALDQTRLTETSVVVGTLACMAPELLIGNPSNPACDWYSWGATLYVLLCTVPPRPLNHLLAYSGGTPAPPLTFPDLDPESPEVACMRAALSLDPERRPRSRRDCERLAREARGGRPRGRTLRRPRRARSWSEAGAVVGVIGVVTFFLGRAGPATAPTPKKEARELACLNALDRALKTVDFSDPARWSEFEERLPELPGDLHFEGELLARARLLDREWLTRRMPRPLGERIGAPPKAPEEVLPKGAEELLASSGLKGPLAAPTREALRIMDRVEAERMTLLAQLHAYRRGGNPPPRMDASLVSIGRYLHLGSLVDTAVGSREGRRGVLAFLAPASLEMRRAILALDRALKLEPSAAVRTELVQLSESFFRHCRPFFYGEIAYLDPWRRGLPGPRNGAQEVVLAHLSFRVAKPRRMAGLEWRGGLRWAALGLRRVYLDARETDGLRVQATRLLVEILVDLGDRSVLNQDLVAALPVLRGNVEDWAKAYKEAAVLLEPGDLAVEALRREWPQGRAELLEQAEGSPRTARLVASLDL